MAFEYLGGSLDLFRLIFEQILKISPTLLYKYPTVQEQVFYLILLPHVILFLFLFFKIFSLLYYFFQEEMRARAASLNRDDITVVGAAAYHPQPPRNPADYGTRASSQTGAGQYRQTCLQPPPGGIFLYGEPEQAAVPEY